MKFLLKRIRQSGASSSRVAGILVISAFIILTALFGRAPTARINQPIRTKLAQTNSSAGFSACTSLTWTQLSPAGAGPDLNSQQFVSDGKGNLIMFGGCGPTGCRTSTDTFVLRDAFGVAGTTNWVQLTTTGGPPGARNAHVLAYDSNLNELIVSG